MHVALFSPDWPPGRDPNGIVTYVDQMRTALIAMGHEVTVLAGTRAFPDGGEAIDFAPVAGTLRRRWRRLERQLREGAAARQVSGDIAAAIASAQRRFGFDLIEMEESFGWSAAVQARVAAPVVTRLHGPHFVGQVDPEPPDLARRSAARCAAEADGIRRAFAVTAPSARLLDATLAHVGAQDVPARFIPNPIAVGDETPWSVDTCERRLILCVGRFDRRKGVDVVLAAFAEALGTDPSLRLMLVGPDWGIRMPDGGILRFPDYAARFLAPEVRAAIDQLGPVPSRDIPALRRRAALTLVGSRFENFPYSVAEAMAAGCPIVATDVFGNGEMIRDGETGWLVESEDARGMAAAILHAVAAPDEAARVGEAARVRCREVYAADRVAAESVAFYGETIARWKARSATP